MPTDKEIWEQNADCWDECMGDESNWFHRTVVRPHTEELLAIKPDDLVLDIACGNGNFSQRMAEQGARVVAFDFSEKLIKHAKRRHVAYLDRIAFHVCNATSYNEVAALAQDRPFDKAVANMAVMDIADIEPLFKAVNKLLARNGRFVFSTHHPCFERSADRYRSTCTHQGKAITRQPELQNYYHRSMQEILSLLFAAGFVIDGLYEEYDDDPEIPVVMIVRARKDAASLS